MAKGDGFVNHCDSFVSSNLTSSSNFKKPFGEALAKPIMYITYDVCMMNIVKTIATLILYQVQILDPARFSKAV